MTLVLLWLACIGGEPDPSGSEVPLAPEGSSPEVVGADGVARRPLGARMSFLGGTSVVPRGLSVQLDREVFSEAEVGAPTTAFTVTVDPPVEGTLSVVGPGALEWVPAQPLRPGARYIATLTRVAAPEGELPAGPWDATVDAPRFAVSRAALRRLAPPRQTVSVDLVFTAPPDRASERRELSATLGGTPLDLELEAGEHGAVTLSFVRPAAGESVELVLGDDVGWAGDPSIDAPAGRHLVSLASGPEMRIEEVLLPEGSSGFYVEVVCDDDAAPGESDWRWLPELGSWDLSTRCQLDEAVAASMVHTDPPVPLSFAPGLGGFRVFGDFPRGRLTVTLDGGLVTIDGGVLRAKTERTFDVPARSPTVAFPGQGRYLPRDAWKNLQVRHLNVDRLEVEVRHVPAEDLVFWMTGDEPTTRRTSNRVASASLAVKNDPDREVTSYVDLGSLVRDPLPGVYEVNATGDGRRASARLLLTDLHLVAKADAPEPGRPWTSTIRVWALDVHTGAPRDDVEVRAVRASGQTLGSCETEGARGCVLRLPEDEVDDSPPVALLARAGDDLTYIELEDLRLELPTDAGGRPYAQVTPYDAALWTDRGVYRPGDTARVAAIVRDDRHVAPEAGLPVLLRVFDPRERETRKRVVETNAAGMVTTDLAFGDYASTGRYRVVAEVGGASVGEVTFQVEEFVPERLAVTATAAGEGHLPGEPVDVAVSGQWLFGGSAVGSSVEVTCSLVPDTFEPAGFDGWSFGPAWLTTRPSVVTLGTARGELDEEGRSTVTCPAATGAIQGPTALVARAAVFEGESGRTTVAEARVPVHPEAFWVGLDTAVTRARRGQPVPVRGVVVDWAGRPVTTVGEVTVEILRMEEEWGWWWDEDEGSRQTRTLRPAREETRTVEVVGGKFALDVVPQQDAAGLVVRVRAGRAVSERWIEGTGARFSWEEDGGTVVDSTPRPMRPTRLPIRVEGAPKVGEVTKVTLDAPYAGRVLWTVETDEVLDAVWTEAAPGKNEWRFQLESFVPNVYVSAFLVKDPHLESSRAFLPDRAFGVTSVAVEPARFTRELSIGAPEEVLPYGQLTIDLELKGATGPAFATVAAVDEGILSLTKFPTPDPLAQLFRRRALGVDSYETVGWTRLVEAAGSSSSTGGDEDEEAGGGDRVQMVKPVALWSGLVALDAQGRAKVTFDVPGYRGKLRVMAVAATATEVGRAERQVTVADPLVLLTTLPRFLLAGDTAQIPVQVTNTTDARRDVVVRLEATELQRGAKPDVTDGRPPVPVLTFAGPPEGTLAVEPGASETAVFEVKVRPTPGAAHLLVTASSGALRSKEELDLPIQVAESEVREVRTFPVTGTSTDLKPATAGFVEGTDRSTLWLTANPYATSLTHLRYLVRYPFG